MSISDDESDEDSDTDESDENSNTDDSNEDTGTHADVLNQIQTKVQARFCLNKRLFDLDITSCTVTNPTLAG